MKDCYVGLRLPNISIYDVVVLVPLFAYGYIALQPITASILLDNEYFGLIYLGWALPPGGWLRLEESMCISYLQVLLAFCLWKLS